MKAKRKKEKLKARQEYYDKMIAHMPGLAKSFKRPGSINRSGY